MAFAKPLYVLFQQSITNSVLPSDWTDANICALHKKGARTDPNNYRPVSLTSHVIKTFERLILHHILGYCRKHNILSCNQHGFQAGKSRLTNLLHCMTDWTTSYDKQPKESTDIIYTDFQNALDGPRLLRTVSSTPSFHIPSLSGMLYLQGMICHSSNPKSSLLTCVMAVHSTNHALTAVIMILKDRNSLHIKNKIKIAFNKRDYCINFQYMVSRANY